MSARTNAAAVLAVVLASAAWAQSPQKLAYQGLLLKLDGTPETGTQTVRFSVHDAATLGNELWFESQNIMLTQGYYATVLGDGTALPASVFDGSERYLEIAVNGTAMTPRMRIVSVPYALRAGVATTATNVSGGTVNASSIQVNGNTVIDGSGALAGNTAYTGVNGVTVTGRNIGLRNCAAGEILRWDQPSTSWVCATYVAPNPDAGVIAYTADPDGGLVLMGSNATAFSLLLSCATNQVLKWNGSAWVCANDVDTNTTYGVAAGQGLATSGPGNTLFGLQLCPGQQILKSGGGNWACADDSDIQYVAPANGGLLLTSNGFTLDACPDGYVMKSVGNGQWACAADSDTIFGVVANGGLLKSGNNFRLDTCPNGEVMKSLGSGQWGCRADNNSGGTVTSITAGSGLTGGVINTFGTIDLAPTVPNWTAPGPAACPAGQALRSIGLDGTPVCVPIASAGTVTSIVGAGGVLTSPDAGITTTGTISLAPTVQNWTSGQPACAIGQAIQSIGVNGTVSCITVSLDGGTGGGSVTQVNSGVGLAGGPITGSGTLYIPNAGVTNAMLENNTITVSPGTGLTGGGAVALGGTTTLSLSTPVSLANGGTGATTASGARTAIQAAVRGANSDITSLSGLTTPLSVAQGGTGSATQNFVDLTSSQTIDGVKTFNFTITGSISGNAGTVTNGVYTSGTYADPAWITSLAGTKVSGNIAGTASGFTGSLAGDVTGNQGTTTVVGLRGRPLASTVPSADQVLAWNGTSWVPASVNGAAPVVVNSNTIGLAPCTTGQILKADGGTWLCAPDNNSGGTVTAVTAGNGLWGGTISGIGTISIADAGVTNGMLANPTFTVTAGTGLSGGGTAQLGGSVSVGLSTPVQPANGGTGLSGAPTAAGQFLKSSAVGVWSINTIDASDIATGSLAVARGGTGASTALGARNNLGAAASGPNSDITSLSGLTTALSLAQGGTGATTAPGARSNLGAAASGPNSDITSLSGLTTALSPGQGGTGLASGPAAAGLYLRSSAIGTWATSTIPASDIPNLAGDVAGPLGTTVVGRLQGTAVSNVAPASGQALVYSSSAPASWRAVSPAGDLSGTFLATTVAGLRGTPVSATAPAAGQVLQFNAGSWGPATFAEGDGVVGNEVTNAADGTLTRSGAGTGASPFQLALNLGSANTWTAAQTFNAGAKVGDTQVLDMAGVSTIRFNGAATTTTPMLMMYSTCCNSGIRPVIGHSPTNPDWGLAYDDNTDRFRFQQSNVAIPTLLVDVIASQVAVNGSPLGANALTVTGSTYLNGTTTVNGSLGVINNASVSGSLTVTGDITTSGNFRYSAARSRATYFPANTMTIDQGGDDVLAGTSNGTAYFTSGAAPYANYLTASLNIPDGASITSIYCDYFDNGADNLTIGVYLYSGLQTSTTRSLYASTSVTTTDAVAGGRRVSYTLPTPLTVNNLNSTYYLFIYYAQTALSGGLQRLLGCGAGYTVTAAD